MGTFLLWFGLDFNYIWDTLSSAQASDCTRESGLGKG
jgi:hypothetical protein